jgi:N-acetylneuraminic acid mutarotase
MSTPRTGSAAIGIQDGRVLVFGGLDSNCAAVRTVEAFDPDSGTFQVIATGFPDLTGFSATLLNDGRILIAGGSGNNDWNLTAASWLLKP